MDYDDINTPAIVVVGFIGAILTFVLIVGVQTLYFNYQQTVLDSYASTDASRTADNLIAEQENLLNREGWLSKEDDQVSISIERAMQIVVRELQAAEGDPK